MGDLRAAIEQAKELLLNNDETRQRIDGLTFKSWAGAVDSIKDIWWLAKRVVYVVEILYSEYHNITEEQRIKVAAELLDELIQFGGWAVIFESIDGYAFEMVLSAAVQSLNEKYGKGSWPSMPGMNGIKALNLI